MRDETLTTPDGQALYVRHWPVESPRAAVLLIHGLSEHIARYDHVAAALNAAGFAAMGLDHRAHGRSPGAPRAHVPSIDRLVDDQKQLWDECLKAEYPDMPYFVIGHSLGGNVAVRFTLRYQAEIRGLVTSGAGLILDAPAPLRVLVRFWAGVLPQGSLVGLPSSTISRDVAVVQAYDADPLVYHGKPSFATLRALMDEGNDALQRAPQLTLPMLILHGEADALVTPEASRALYAQASAGDKTLKLYPGLYHEIFNEAEHETILAEVVAWLQDRL